MRLFDARHAVPIKGAFFEIGIQHDVHDDDDDNDKLSEK